MSWNNFIQVILVESPNIGEEMLGGALQLRDIRIQRRRLPPPLKGLTPLEKSSKVYERYVEETIKLKDQKCFMVSIFSS